MMKLVSAKRLARNILDVESVFSGWQVIFFLLSTFLSLLKFISMIYITFIVKTISILFEKRQPRY